MVIEVLRERNLTSEMVWNGTNKGSAFQLHLKLKENS